MRKDDNIYEIDTKTYKGWTLLVPEGKKSSEWIWALRNPANSERSRPAGIHTCHQSKHGKFKPTKNSLICPNCKIQISDFYALYLNLHNLL